MAIRDYIVPARLFLPFGGGMLIYFLESYQSARLPLQSNANDNPWFLWDILRFYIDLF